jgi:ABC-type polysaccharide/polyol phosphate export permease
MYFSGAVTRSGASVVGSANLLTRVYFPRVLVPLSATLSALVDFAIAFAVLGGLMGWYGIRPALSIVLLIPLAALTAVAATGIGMWLAALNVRYRDVQYAIPFLLQLWMFATPVVYPTSIVPERWRALFALNPMTGIIEAYRAALERNGIATRPWFDRQLRLCLLGVMLQLGWEKSFDDTGVELAWWNARVREGIEELGNSSSQFFEPIPRVN